MGAPTAFNAAADGGRDGGGYAWVRLRRNGA